MFAQSHVFLVVPLKDRLPFIPQRQTSQLLVGLVQDAVPGLRGLGLGDGHQGVDILQQCVEVLLSGQIEVTLWNRGPGLTGRGHGHGVLVLRAGSLRGGDIGRDLRGLAVVGLEDQQPEGVAVELHDASLLLRGKAAVEGAGAVLLQHLSPGLGLLLGNHPALLGQIDVGAGSEGVVAAAVGVGGTGRGDRKRTTEHFL